MSFHGINVVVNIEEMSQCHTQIDNKSIRKYLNIRQSHQCFGSTLGEKIPLYQWTYSSLYVYLIKPQIL